MVTGSGRQVATCVKETLSDLSGSTIRLKGGVLCICVVLSNVVSEVIHTVLAGAPCTTVALHTLPPGLNCLSGPPTQTLKH